VIFSSKYAAKIIRKLWLGVCRRRFLAAGCMACAGATAVFALPDAIGRKIVDEA